LEWETFDKISGNHTSRRRRRCRGPVPLLPKEQPQTVGRYHRQRLGVPEDMEEQEDQTYEGEDKDEAGTRQPKEEYVEEEVGLYAVEWYYPNPNADDHQGIPGRQKQERTRMGSTLTEPTTASNARREALKSASNATAKRLGAATGTRRHVHGHEHRGIQNGQRSSVIE